MQKIIRFSNNLKRNEIMELIAPFKPIPIIDILKSKGFKIWHQSGKTYIFYK
jgi:hypothetical protein